MLGRCSRNIPKRGHVKDGGDIRDDSKSQRQGLFRYPGTDLHPLTLPQRTGSRGIPPALAPELKKLTLAAQEKKKEVILEKETKLEKKDTKAKIQESKVDEKETKAVAKAYVSPLKLTNPQRHINYMCNYYSSTASSKKKIPAAAAKLKRGQSNLFASWGNAPKKSVESAESASESNSVCFYFALEVLCC